MVFSWQILSDSVNYEDSYGYRSASRIKNLRGYQHCLGGSVMILQGLRFCFTCQDDREAVRSNDFDFTPKLKWCL